jgi:DNA primase
VLALPAGKDPDELIRQDAGAWVQAVEAAKPVVDHMIDAASSALDLNDPRQRSQLVTEVMPVIGELTDPVLQAHYLQRLSRLAKVTEEVLRREMPRRARPSRQQDERPETAGTPVRTIPSPDAMREEFCLALLHREPALGPLGQRLNEDDFSLSENRELFRRWRNAEQVREEDAALWEHYEKVMATRIPMSEIAQLEVAFLDCVARMEQARIRAVKEASALALAEGLAGVRPGQVAAIARAKLEAGLAEGVEDEAALAAADLFLEDHENSLNLHRRLLESSRSDQPGRQPQDPVERESY